MGMCFIDTTRTQTLPCDIGELVVVIVVVVVSSEEEEEKVWWVTVVKFIKTIAMYS